MVHCRNDVQYDIVTSWVHRAYSRGRDTTKDAPENGSVRSSLCPHVQFGASLAMRRQVCLPNTCSAKYVPQSGWVPSTSVKPYSRARPHEDRVAPLFSATRGSDARAATARPM